MKRQLIIGTLGLLLAVSPATAGSIEWPEGQQILVNHPPTQAGGPASDTEFLDSLGNPFWQQSADEFFLADSAAIAMVNWWGFVDLDNPPASETMRIRFYDARPSDGLPGNVLFEESFLNPSRMATGEIVGSFNLPHEYFYSAELSTPIGLDAGTTYWLEVVQVGDPNTFFRWEFAPAISDVIARRNPSAPNWTYSALNANLAFQLWTIPEPLTSLLLAPALAMRGRRAMPVQSGRQTCHGGIA